MPQAVAEPRRTQAMWSSYPHVTLSSRCQECACTCDSGVFSGVEDQAQGRLYARQVSSMRYAVSLCRCLFLLLHFGLMTNSSLHFTEIKMVHVSSEHSGNTVVTKRQVLP